MTDYCRHAGRVWDTDTDADLAIGYPIEAAPPVTSANPVTRLDPHDPTAVQGRLSNSLLEARRILNPWLAAHTEPFTTPDLAALFGLPIDNVYKVVSQWHAAGDLVIDGRVRTSQYGHAYRYRRI